MTVTTRVEQCSANLLVAWPMRAGRLGTSGGSRHATKGAKSLGRPANDGRENDLASDKEHSFARPGLTVVGVHRKRRPIPSLNPAHLHPLAAALAAAALTFTLSGAGQKSVRVEKILLAEQDLGDGMSPAKNSCGWGPACSEQTKAADGGITLGERRIMGTRHEEKPCGVACSLPPARARAGRPERRWPARRAYRRNARRLGYPESSSLTPALNRKTKTLP